MKKTVLIFLLFPAILSYGQADLEEFFNLSLEFGAPREVIQLFQPFRTHRTEPNGGITYVAQEDHSLLHGRPFSEYQIWYTIDEDLGLYQSTLLLRGENSVLQNVLTSYLRKFSRLYGEPVYNILDNGSFLIFWFDESNFTVQARLILDVASDFRFVSVTFCSPLTRHIPLLASLYSGFLDYEEPSSPEPESLEEDD